MTDLMDQRLTRAAHRWQAEQPTPPPVPLDRLDEPTGGHRHRRVALAAAAAAVLVGGGTVALTHHGGHDAATPTGPTSPHTVRVHRTPAGAVPFRAIPVPRVGKGDGGSRYRLVVAAGQVSGHAHPGDTLVFTATLASPTQLSLTPCPSYDIAFGAYSFDTWRLNCAQVPYRDTHGRPVLPAKTPVSFQMRVTVPDVQGRQKVLWTLNGPKEMPGFYGLVDVSSP